MKYMLSGLVCCSLVLMLPARAAEGPVAPTPKAREQAKLEKAINQQQASVKQLQDQVGHEESKTHQTDEKLKQQDQAIAELQRQLDALKKAPQGGGHP
ncbi:hypothetical protein [Dyella sp. 20L07]|uniref:hypothetical protein n=1 Tax=Dyella sp. 20L07 TaxID=3384240 RepID=UPI003D284595